MPVSQAVVKNVLPAIAAMLMVLIYNLADTFFIGQTHDALQVAAVSLATPVFLIFMAVGTIFGVGGTSAISRALGEGRQEYARKVSAFCMWSCAFTGVIMSLPFWIFLEQILSFIGASPDTWALAKSYLAIVISCGPFVLIGNCYSNILRTEGQAAKAMMGMTIGNLIKIILDPIMILGLGWNISGAAIATVIGNICGALYYIVYFLRGQSTLSISPKDFTRKSQVASSVLTIGIPASLGSLLMSVSSIILNHQMAAYGDMALAGILGFALILGASLTAVCYAFADQLISAFLTDSSAFDYGVQFAKILLCTSALFGVFYVLLNALQAMGAAAPSLIINLSRQGLIDVPALFMLETAWSIHGLIWAQPIADLLSLGLTLLLYLITSKKLSTDTIVSKQNLTLESVET